MQTLKKKLNRPEKIWLRLERSSFEHYQKTSTNIFWRKIVPVHLKKNWQKKSIPKNGVHPIFKVKYFENVSNVYPFKSHYANAFFLSFSHYYLHVSRTSNHVSKHFWLTVAQHIVWYRSVEWHTLNDVRIFASNIERFKFAAAFRVVKNQNQYTLRFCNTSEAYTIVHVTKMCRLKHPGDWDLTYNKKVNGFDWIADLMDSFKKFKESSNTT